MLGDSFEALEQDLIHLPPYRDRLKALVEKERGIAENLRDNPWKPRFCEKCGRRLENHEDKPCEEKIPVWGTLSKGYCDLCGLKMSLHWGIYH